MIKYKNSIRLIFSIIAICLVISLFLSLNSHWSTGKNDYSEIVHIENNFSKTKNKMGGFGAISSDFLIRIFGISSYILVLLFFFISLKICFRLKKINLLSLFSYSAFSLLWISLFSSIFLDLIYVGKLGLFINDQIKNFIGLHGIYIALISTILIFIVLVFRLEPKDLSKFYKQIISLFSKLKKYEYSNIVDETLVIKDEKALDLESNISNSEKKIFNQKKYNADDNSNRNDEIIIEKINEEDKLQHNIGDSITIDGTKNVEYVYPSLEILKQYSENKISVNQDEVENNKKLIEETLKDFRIDVIVKRATVGPTITLYEIVPDTGVKISKIKNLENDIALRIKAIGVRIIAPLPGKGTVGIEVPNQKPTIVSMKDVIASEKFQKSNFELPVAIGKTISNETFVMDLTKMPHLLIAGATGQGKSVGLNAILCSILFKKHPNDVKFILVDPKKVELTLYNKIERNFLAKLPTSEESIITDTKSVINTLKSLCLEMDNRYELLKKAEVRNVQEYNSKIKSKQLSTSHGHKFLPYLILVIDEFADLIMTAGKEIEIPIARLAQLSRAVGIHLIIATQRPTTNIITGTIKANFPTRIAFRVIQGIDSKTILDTVGANQLIGRGDMLVSTGNSILRIQCAFIDTPEVEKLTNFIHNQKNASSTFSLPEQINEETASILSEEDRDPLFREAAQLIVMHQQGSTSMIQRKLKLGYNRAGRIIDQLEAAGIIGPLQGSKGRQVMIENEDQLNKLL